MEELANLLTTNNIEGATKFRNAKISVQFIIGYLAYGKNIYLARLFNRYLYKIKEKYIRDALYYNVSKSKCFFWERGYIKKPKTIQLPDFELRVKKYFGWSKKEYKENLDSVMQNKIWFCEKLKICNRDRKLLGVEKIATTKKIKKPNKIQTKSLSAWF